MQPGIIDAENGEAEAHRRVRGLGLRSDALARSSWYGCDAGDLLNPAGRVDLEATIAECRPTLVVLDSLASLWRGRENEAENIGPDLDALRNLVRRYDTAALLLHHNTKVPGSGYRGSTAIGAACEVVASLGREDGDDDPERLVLSVSKVRMAARPPRRWLRLSAERGAVLVDEAEPYGNDDASPSGRPAVVREQVGAQVLRVLSDAAEPMSTAAITRALGRRPKDATTRRVLSAMLDAREVFKTPAGYSVEGVSEVSEPLRGASVLTPPGDSHSYGVSGGCHDVVPDRGSDTPSGDALARAVAIARAAFDATPETPEGDALTAAQDADREAQDREVPW